MTISELHTEALLTQGYSTFSNIYSNDELEQILSLINRSKPDKATFRKSTDLFAIRQFLKEIPGILPVVLNEYLLSIIHKMAGPDYFIVKSIYFDKPPSSNWFVSYHQDLTISVDHKNEIHGFGPWTVKQHQFAVQPPVEYLENIITLRIHLDETDENNGALKVIPGSHLKNIYRPETIDWMLEKEMVCSVEKGGIMIMKPLLLHSSGRTINNQRRRVIHIELSNLELPAELKWAERIDLSQNLYAKPLLHSPTIHKT